MNVLTSWIELAGIAGLGVGALILIYRDVLAKNIFSTMSKKDSYRIIRLMIILVWTVAILTLVFRFTGKQSLVDGEWKFDSAMADLSLELGSSQITPANLSRVRMSVTTIEEHMESHSSDLSATYSELGRAYLEMGYPDRAVEYFWGSIDKAAASNDPMHISRQLVSIARLANDVDVNNQRLDELGIATTSTIPSKSANAYFVQLFGTLRLLYWIEVGDKEKVTEYVDLIIPYGLPEDAKKKIRSMVRGMKYRHTSRDYQLEIKSLLSVLIADID
jgi:hypothetical protein